LSARQGQRATLLVSPDNERAYNAYRRWGWYKVTRLQPGRPNAPVFDVLLPVLPLKAGT